jgi:hypothetical protein
VRDVTVALAVYFVRAALAHSTTEIRYTYAPRATIDTQKGGPP